MTQTFLIYPSPHTRKLNMAKKIPRQFGQWNPPETPICFNIPLVLKKFLGPFLCKCILEIQIFILKIFKLQKILGEL